MSTLWSLKFSFCCTQLLSNAQFCILLLRLYHVIKDELYETNSSIKAEMSLSTEVSSISNSEYCFTLQQSLQPLQAVQVNYILHGVPKKCKQL